MADPTAPTLESELRAMQAWWRDAGVDQAFVDAPTDWLAPAPEEIEASEDDPAAARAEPAAPEPPRELLAGGPENWPTTLDAFDAWWLAEPALELGPRQRVSARGPAGAELMVLVPQPEADDTQTLLSGPQGVLLGNMLAAFGLAPEACRIASLIPSHLPHPDWPALDRIGWGELTRHHVALARPKRLIAFGQVALPLLGHDTAQGPASFTEIKHVGGTIAALAARSLDTLLLRPRLKAGLWQRWLEWTNDG